MVPKGTLGKRYWTLIGPRSGRLLSRGNPRACGIGTMVVCPETVLRVGGLLNLPTLFVLTHLQVFCSTWRVPVCAERPDLQTNGQQLASSFSRTTTTANAEQVEVGILSHVYCTRASSRSPTLTASAQGRGQRPAALCRSESFACARAQHERLAAQHSGAVEGGRLSANRQASAHGDRPGQSIPTTMATRPSIFGRRSGKRQTMATRSS